MKTTLIQLENHDDIVSARDKMGWAKGGRILLVWPERDAPLNRRLDLVLLQRHSAVLGCPLAFVSQEPEVRYHALRLGIPVYKSLKQAQKEHWRVPHRFRRFALLNRGGEPVSKPGAPNGKQAKPPLPAVVLEAGMPSEPPAEPNLTVDGLLQPDNPLEPPAASPEISLQKKLPNRPEIDERILSPAARLIYFGLGVLALLAIAAVLVPNATLLLTPQTRVQDVVLSVSTAPNLSAAEITGAVPSHWMTAAVEGRDSLPASSTLPVAEQAASGEATFINLTDAPVDIPAGTEVLTGGGNPVVFSVAAAGKVPAGPGEQLSLPVQALDPGEIGNQPAGSLIAIEGLLGTQVSVTNSQPTSGGASRLVPAPSDEDRRMLRDRLFASLQNSALSELQAQLEPGDVIIPQSLQPVQTIQAEYQPEVGQPADRLVLSMRVQYKALVVSAKDLQAMAQGIFDANLPNGFTVVPDSLRVETVTPPEETISPGGVTVPPGGETNENAASGPAYHWQMHAYRWMIAAISEPQAVRLVLGSTRDKAILRLEAALPLDGPARLAVQPAWWPRLPVLPFRIRLETVPNP